MCLNIYFFIRININKFLGTAVTNYQKYCLHQFTGWIKLQKFTNVNYKSSTVHGNNNA